MSYILKLLYTKYWIVRTDASIARHIVTQLFDDFRTNIVMEMRRINLHPKFKLHRSKSSQF